MEIRLKKGSKLDLPVQDRILFHLATFSSYNPTWEVPEGMTQQGIADALVVSRCNVSRVMSKLTESGLVEEMKEHVKGKERKRKVYVLSTQGRLHLNDIINDYGQKMVEVLDNERVVTISLQDAYLNQRVKDLCKKESLFFNILDALHAEGVFLVPDTPMDERRCHFCSKVPVFGYFIGRTEESTEILQAINQGDPVVITGIAGIGKTALAYHVAQDKSDNDVFWMRLFEWTTMQNFLKELGNFLLEGGDRRLDAHLSEGETVSSESLQEITEIVLDYIEEGRDLLIVLDDFHKLSPDVEFHIIELLKGLLGKMEMIEGGKMGLLITTRYRINNLMRLEIPSVKIKEIYLSGLDADSVELLLKRKSKETFSTDDVIRITRGHPLALELLDSIHPEAGVVFNGTKLVQSQVRQYLFEEIFDKLSEQQKEMLMKISVYRQPVPYHWLMADNRSKKAVLEDLINNNFIERFPRGYWIHDLIRSYFIEATPVEQLISAHEIAARNYSQAITDLYDANLCIEMLVHLLKARKHKEMIDNLHLYGSRLIDGGVSENLFQILNEVREEDVKEEGWKLIVFLKGMAHLKMGQPSTAEDYLKYCIALTEDDTTPVRNYKCINTLSFIYISEGDWVTAHKVLDPLLALKNVRKGPTDIALEYAEALRHQGLIHWRQGDMEEAEKSFQKALGIVESKGPSNVLIDTLIDLGNLLKDRGDWEKSLDYYYSSIEIAIRSDNITGQLRGRLNAGAALVHLERYEEAKQFFSTNLQLAMQTGSRRYTTWNSFNLAEVLVHFEEFDNALRLNREAFLSSQRANDIVALAYSYRVYGIIYRETERYEESLDHFIKCLELLESIDAKYHLGESYLELGKYYLKVGDPKAANKALNQSMKMFKLLGNLGYQKRVRSIMP